MENDGSNATKIYKVQILAAYNRRPMVVGWRMAALSGNV